MKLSKIMIILFFPLFALNLSASIDILKTSELFIDGDKKYNIENIDNAKFKPSDTSKVHRGYTDEVIWVKFSIQNDQDLPLKKVLVIDNQMLDHITLFRYKPKVSGLKDDKEYKKELKGVLHGKNFEENILDFYFNIELKPKETKHYYLKVSSLSCAVYFTLKLMDKNELYKQELKHQLILVLFFGAILALILYNIFIGYFTKDITYVYYVLFQFFTLWNHGSYTGISFYVIKYLQEDILETDAYLAIFYMSFITIFSLLFTRKFLNIKKYKKIDTVFKGIIVLSILILAVTSKEFYPIDITVAVFFISLSFLIAVSYYLFYKKEENSRYFILGWSVVFIGWYMLATYQYGYYSTIDNFEYFYELTVFCEAILLSVALSARLNKVKKLETSLKKNEILIKELHHRVKNSMQFIIAMYRLKLSKFINKDLKNHPIKNSLNE